MTFKECIQYFREKRINPWLYVDQLGGLGSGEYYGVERTAQGWHVHYSERGQKTTQDFFVTELEAIECFKTGVEEAHSFGKGSD